MALVSQNDTPAVYEGRRRHLFEWREDGTEIRCESQAPGYEVQFDFATLEIKSRYNETSAAGLTLL